MRPLAENIHVRLQNELLRAIDDFRRSQADPPSRPKAVRDLVQEALTARQAEADLHQQGA